MHFLDVFYEFYKIFYNNGHNECAVRLKIVSINNKCNFQISLLLRPNFMSVYSLLLCCYFSFKELKRPSVQGVKKDTKQKQNRDKAECAIYFPCKLTPFKPAPNTHRHHSGCLPLFTVNNSSEKKNNLFHSLYLQK